MPDAPRGTAGSGLYLLRSALALVAGARRRWSRYGTLRAPGPDLARMPIGLDLEAISLSEGLRAAVGTGLILLINLWIGSQALTLAAFAANLTCFCDTGGPVRDRVPALLAFTVFGAAIWSVLGLLHVRGWLLLVPFSGLVVFCNSMARVWGMRAQAVGNVLTVVVALAVDKSLDSAAAAVLFGAFMLGGAWAVLLTLGIWRIHPYRPAAHAVMMNWRRLASLARDLIDLTAASETQAARWEGHARGHRRAVRDGLEESRELLLGSIRSPGPLSPESSRGILALEAAEQIFGALIAFSDILESDTDPVLREEGLKILRRLRPMLVLLGQEVEGVSDRVETSIDRMEADGRKTPAFAAIVAVLAERLRVAFGLKRELGRPAPTRRSAGPSWLRLAAGPLLSNLTWDSAVLRHAARASLLTMAAVAVSIAWWTPYAHWLTITVALTMQPYFAATWQRALERIGGTLIGGLLGAALAFVPPSPLAHTVLLIPLSVLGFSVRQVSYGAYITCLTPLVVLLFEVAEPGHSEWVIAGWRTFYTIAGGGIAVMACMVLWPSWEPDRTLGELKQALAAHAAYACAVFDRRSGQGRDADLEEARRRAGLASNNLEASLSRALQEPRRRRSRRLERLLAVDAALRRLAGAFVTLHVDPTARGDVDEASWQDWRRYVPEALTCLAEGRRVPAPAPKAPPRSLLGRLGRAIALLEETLQPSRPPSSAQR